MAYINVAEWSVENVVDWLKGEKFKKIFFFVIHTNGSWLGRQKVVHPIFGYLNHLINC